MQYPDKKLEAKLIEQFPAFLAKCKEPYDKAIKEGKDPQADFMNMVKVTTSIDDVLTIFSVMEKACISMGGPPPSITSEDIRKFHKHWHSQPRTPEGQYEKMTRLFLQKVIADPWYSDADRAKAKEYIMFIPALIKQLEDKGDDFSPLRTPLAYREFEAWSMKMVQRR